MKYFLDTFAIVEMIKGNENYLPYFDEELITLYQNLAELTYGFEKEGNRKLGMVYFKKYSSFSVALPQDIIIDAMKFRYLHKKKKLSYIDCLGYMYAKRYGYKFLTGDEGFREIEDVEFVK